LDPRISYEALRKYYADDADLLGDLEISKATLETHFEANYADTTADPSEPASALLDPVGSPQKIDFTSRYRRHEDSSASDELAEYFRLTSVPEGWEVEDKCLVLSYESPCTCVGRRSGAHSSVRCLLDEPGRKAAKNVPQSLSFVYERHRCRLKGRQPAPYGIRGVWYSIAHQNCPPSN
jgi:hypothetical protein